ncbi:MAG: carboxypeptidase-like regulatory domain-containing protein [Cytophagaceae bacterium]|nr:MAG: carboxypeptidase-like regulatory domain-containing protein [Cytophagaceae bacterium]
MLRLHFAALSMTLRFMVIPMKFWRLFLALFLWLGFALAAQAQGGRVTGVVQDSVTHEPLAFSSVFLANTTLGATTNENGVFTLERVPKGNYDLVGSYVGYRLSKQPITVVTGSTTPPVTLRLASSGPQLGEVVVKADAHQEDNYRKFSGLFLGSTTFSKQCRITNPEDVDVVYNDTTKDLVATTDNFVQVENKALGYRIKYYGLHFQYNEATESAGFDGQTVFEEMTPKDDKQRRQWEANRLAAYNGSLTHFLKTVYDNQVAENNFLAQQVRLVQPPRATRAEAALRKKKTPLTAADQDSLKAWAALPPTAQLNYAARPIDSLRRVSADGLHTFLRFSDELQVVYFGEAPDPGYTAAMSPIGPATKTMPGEYWGFQKIGEFLPLDYAPPVAAAPATAPATQARAK